MKYFLLFLFLITVKISFCQSDTTLTYTDIVQVEGINKQSLYERARSWANDVFKSSKDVIQINDKEIGEIAGKATFNASFSWNALGKRTATTDIDFKFEIIVKEGKYKYVFTDLTEDGYYGYLLTSAQECPYKTKGQSKSNSNMVWTSLKESSDNTMHELINSLKKAMQSKSDTDF